MNNSPPNSSGAECWICRDSGSTPENPIIIGVCRCIGSIGSVHQNCIDRWVFQNERIDCPSCGVAYSIVYMCPQMLAFPKSTLSEAELVARGFLVPILTKLIVLTSEFLASFLLVPLVIGFLYYWEKAWLRGSFTVSWVRLLEVYTYGVTNVFLIRLTILGFKHWTRHLRLHQRRLQQHNPLMDRRVHAPGRPAVEANDNNFHPYEDGLEVSDKDSEGYDSESEDIEAFCDLSKTGFVASVHDWIDSMTKKSGVDNRLFFSLARDLGIAGPLALILRAPQGLTIVVTMFVVAWVLCQLWIPRRKIKNPRRRYEEVMEHLRVLSPTEAAFLYFTYILETLAFSFILPIIAGVVIHYGAAPFLAKAPESLSSFLEGLNIFKVVGYWVIGMLCSLVLMATIYNVIAPLFAPGVELFYIRNVDFRSLDSHTLRLNLMFTRVFDIGPAQLVFDFLEILVFEIGALLFFIAVPCWITFGIREALFGDLSSGRLPIPLSFGVPSRGDLPLKHKVADVQQLLRMSQKFNPYNFSVHPVLENMSNTRTETVMPTHLAEVVSSDPQAISKALMLLSLDNTSPLYRLTTLALIVAALRNDTTIVSKLLLLQHQDRNVIDTAWFLFRVFSSSGYMCPACLLSVGPQLSFFTMPEFASSSPPSNGKHVEECTSENTDERLMDSPQQNGKTTADFLFSRDFLVTLGLNVPQWKGQWVVPMHGIYADDQNKSIEDFLHDNSSTVHEPQRIISASEPEPEAIRWTPEKVLNWNDSSMVCLVLLLITCLCRIPGFGPISRFALNFLLYQSGFALFLQSISLVSLALTFFTCLLHFPIQKMQLRCLLPFVLFLGRHMGLESFLFDSEQLKLVNEFLRDSNLDHLDLPIVPPEAILLRRELTLPSRKIPSYYKLRLFLFAMSFLLVGTLLFWLPFILIFSLMLCVPLPTITMLLGAGCMFFFFFDPSEFFECVLLAHGLILMLLGFTVFSSYWALSKLSLKKLARETFFYMCKVERHVSVYDLGKASSGGGDHKGQEMFHIVLKTSPTEWRPIHVPALGDNNDDGSVPER